MRIDDSWIDVFLSFYLTSISVLEWFKGNECTIVIIASNHRSSFLLQPTYSVSCTISRDINLLVPGYVSAPIILSSSSIRLELHSSHRHRDDDVVAYFLFGSQFTNRIYHEVLLTCFGVFGTDALLVFCSNEHNSCQQ